jgi:uncharacterized protein YndB with AHSA1/START domain
MDVEVVRDVPARPDQVAAIMFDPARDPEWIGGARSVELLSADPTAPGARTRRKGGFMGKKFSWVTEVEDYAPGRLLRMRFVEGPMKGGVTYRIEPRGEGSRVSIRNHGGSSFSFPGMAWMLKRSVGKDLDRLRRLVAASR